MTPATKKDHSEWLWLPLVALPANGGLGDKAHDQVVLIVWAVVLGAAAAYTGRDSRERLTGALATVPVLAVGLLAMGLLSPGWALLVTLSVATALVAALVGWHKRRTPPEADTPPVPEQVSGSGESLTAAPEPKPRTPAERRAANERRLAQGADEYRRRQAEQAAEYEREAEQRRQQGAKRRLAEQRRGSLV